MSWIIRQLLLNRNKIKSNIYDDEYSSTIPAPVSDNYDDIIVVEKKIDELINFGALSDLELSIIRELSSGKNISELSRQYNLSRITIKSIFVGACDKIAFSLGGEFTDYGYIDYIINKYKLTDDKIKLLIELILNEKEE